jgi:hypothetical protein
MTLISLAGQQFFVSVLHQYLVTGFMAMKMCIAVLFIVCFLELWFHCVHSAWSVIYLVKLLNTVIFVYRGNAFFLFSKQCKSLPTQNIRFWNGVIHSVCYIVPHDMALPLHSLCLCSLHSIIISPGSLHVGSHSYDSILHGYLKSCKFKLDSNQKTAFSFKTAIWKVANPDWGWNQQKYSASVSPSTQLSNIKVIFLPYYPVQGSQYSAFACQCLLQM